MAAAAKAPRTAPHIPVLLRPLLAAVAPVTGVWVDGTLGAGGYARALLQAGADRVIGIDRDPLALELARGWVGEFGDRLVLQRARFSQMDEFAQNANGVVLDLGVSSMQLDDPMRGFSFQKDGPLDMRMSQQGPSAVELVNEADEADLADLLFLFGEERASRRIARAIVAARQTAPIVTTGQLAGIVEGCLPRARPGQAHPVTRSFQAIRIAVNDEFGELVSGLEAAARALAPGGKLAVVTFHSIEDRMVKRFFQAKSGGGGRGSRHAPEIEHDPPEFELASRKAILPDKRELDENPRSRSAKLRVAIRTEAPATPADRKSIGMPVVKRGK